MPVLLPVVALLGSTVVLLAPGPSVAQSALQAHWSQSLDTVVAAALPVDVTVGLTAVPSGVPEQPTTFALVLPTGPVVVTGQPTPDPPTSSSSDQQSTWSSAATLTLPSGVPCGSYRLVAAQSFRQSSTTARSAAAWTASGRISVVGCPPELEVSPVDEVLTTPTLPFSFRGRAFPSGRVGAADGSGDLRLLVDGEQVGADIPAGRGDVTFHRTAELALACGDHEVAVTAAGGERLASRAVRLRCPSVALDADGADRTELPLDVGLGLSGFASSTPYDVLLDGAPAASGTTDGWGTGRSSVPVPERAVCGQHAVTVRQVLPAVPQLPAYPESEPEPEPEPEPEDEQEGQDEQEEQDEQDEQDEGGDDGKGVDATGSEPTATPTAATTPTAGPAVTVQPVPSLPGGPAVVLRAAVQDLPAERTAEVTVPLTVRCPEVAGLEVHPSVRADDGTPVTYSLTGDGFGDELAVEVSAAGAVVLPARTDGLGRLSDRVELRLPCGTTTFTARDAGGRTAQDSVEVRCPALRLDPGTVSSAELPRGVSAQASGFDGDAELDVLLDGDDLAHARSDAAGSAVVDVRAGTGLDCGAHRVEVRQRAREPAPSAHATLTVACPPPATPVIDVAPEVVTDGHTVRVAGRDLPAGELRLVWRLPDGEQRPALRRAVSVEDGRLQVSVLVLRGEPAGPRQLLALGASVVAADADQTLVVPDSVQPGRRTSASRVGLLGRR